MLLKGRKILVGISGGIAAYKVYDLVRTLVKEGASVRTVLTPSALDFVSPLVLATLTGSKPFYRWDEESPLAHVELAKWADAFLVAPATVNTISKLALGLADNPLTAAWSAFAGPKLVAPAANTVMLQNPAVRNHLETLRRWGVEVIPPDRGLLACGDEGEGKLADVDLIRDHLVRALSPKPLKGKKVLVTLGATREYLDPVRFISNGSSGKMGLALAKAVFYLGGEPLVVAADAKVSVPERFLVRRVETAGEMLEACLELFDGVDAVLMNAAVSDYRFSKRFDKKLKKSQKRLTVELEPTPDVLAELGKRKKRQKLVGFAVESENLEENALKKLKKKNLDAIVVNPVSVMGSDRYEGTIIFADGRKKELKAPSKEEAAYEIVSTLLGS
ncbi:MAG: bifunctional phosphopantothenoylcysteine decarboxylase/phosphopantothenate--cysteine ligase CoaBC [Aquificae bacterium]|nr:bifunctional phosphopantothenoylcysteine decarboxylase/phosphopantothenate--cysteine ligase CoaBC [Aquificota bacterium]